ncbi:DUF4352 domain-containing protein [Streptodolium elevatio]|uniref:DUF4352 domain-containing protein n=1 Tax=Streptodolium elevatio TaxID=3157996 RepID=A0ABV3DK04_9ACTN
MNRAITALAAAATALLLAACSDDGDKLVTQPNAPSIVTAPTQPGAPPADAPAADATTPAAAPSSTAPAQPPAAKIGDTITIKGSTEGNSLDATIVKIVDPAAASNEYMTANAGQRFVAVQWRIVNNGVRPIDVGPTSGSSVIDVDGQQFSPTYQPTTAGPAYPSSSTIPVGGTRLGFVVYEVPKASKIREIQFDPSMGLGSQIGQWTVG